MLLLTYLLTHTSTVSVSNSSERVKENVYFATNTVLVTGKQV